MTEKNDRLATRDGSEDLKVYRKPTLTRGPALSDISAEKAVSGKR